MKSSPPIRTDSDPKASFCKPPCRAEVLAQLRKIERGLRAPRTGNDKYCLLYAAQQALHWALDVRAAGTPYSVIMAGKIAPLRRDTPAS